MPFGIGGGRGSVLAGDANSIRAAAADLPDAPAESSAQQVQTTEQANTVPGNEAHPPLLGTTAAEQEGQRPPGSAASTEVRN